MQVNIQKSVDPVGRVVENKNYGQILRQGQEKDIVPTHQRKQGRKFENEQPLLPVQLFQFQFQPQFLFRLRLKFQSY